MLFGKTDVSHRMGPLSPMFFVLIVVGVLFVACPAPEDDVKKKATDKDNLITLIGEAVADQDDAVTPNLNGIDTSAVKDMSNLFRILENQVTGVSQSKFNPDISGWDVSMVTNMSGMFHKASSFNADISGWNVSMVTNMPAMFHKASSFNADISGWNVSMVTNMSGMFNEAVNFNQNLDEWDEHFGDKTIDKIEMFDGSGLANNPPRWYTP